MVCPGCKENRAHRSHRTNIKDWAVNFVGRRPYRCHACNRRFYAYRDGAESTDLRTPEERRVIKLRRGMKWRRSRTELALYVISSLILMAVLYYLFQQRIEGV